MNRTLVFSAFFTAALLLLTPQIAGAAANDTMTDDRTFIFECGDPITVNHTTANGVAPVNKTVIYGTVLTNLTGSNKCWITKNLGADQQAISATDSSEASAGWYWRFNRKQGYKHDGSTRTPSTTWTSSISESSNWSSANDPCTIELGAGWRLPTSAEWTAADSNGAWGNYNNTYASVLKLHAAGFLYHGDGALDDRGSNGTGRYWSSTQYSTKYGSISGDNLYFFFAYSNVEYSPKASGYSVRCLKE